MSLNLILYSNVLIASADIRIALLVQIPYGIVADNYGRRLVLFLGLLGNLLGSCWTVIVCKLGNTSSLSKLQRLIVILQCSILQYSPSGTWC